ncbi:MAG: hypothetical protein ACKVQT_14840 [Burkholderiales bacterium]
MRTAGTLVAALSSVLLLVACPTTPLTGAPADFAVYDKGDVRQAVSFDRVVYQVKRVENKPLADLAFWRVALKEHVEKAGYVVTTDGAIDATGKPGYYIESTAPRGTADYIYLVALFVHDKNLIVIESAGEVEAYKSKRDKIFAAIKATDLAGAGGR